MNRFGICLLGLFVTTFFCVVSLYAGDTWETSNERFFAKQLHYPNNTYVYQDQVLDWSTPTVQMSNPTIGFKVASERVSYFFFYCTDDGTRITETNIASVDAPAGLFDEYLDNYNRACNPEQCADGQKRDDITGECPPDCTEQRVALVAECGGEEFIDTWDESTCSGTCKINCMEKKGQDAGDYQIEVSGYSDNRDTCANGCQIRSSSGISGIIRNGDTYTLYVHDAIYTGADCPDGGQEGEQIDPETGSTLINPGDGETGDGDAGDGETGGGETGDGETGDGETGDGETGDGSDPNVEYGDGYTINPNSGWRAKQDPKETPTTAAPSESLTDTRLGAINENLQAIVEQGNAHTGYLNQVNNNLSWVGENAKRTVDNLKALGQTNASGFGMLGGKLDALGEAIEGIGGEDVPDEAVVAGDVPQLFGDNVYDSDIEVLEPDGFFELLTDYVSSNMPVVNYITGSGLSVSGSSSMLNYSFNGTSIEIDFSDYEDIINKAGLVLLFVSALVSFRIVIRG